MSTKNFGLGVVTAMFLASAMYAQAPQQNAPVTPAPAQNASPQNTPANAPQNGQAQNPAAPNSAPAPGAAAKATTSFSETDKQFIQKVSADGLGEVQLGQLALQKASSDDVKKFAQRIVDDHTKANQQLQQIASSSGATVAQQPAAGVENAKQQLSAVSGTAFDQYYMALMLQDHDNAVAEFTHENLVGQNTSLKSFANSTLPVLEEHLTTVRNIINAQNGPARPATQPASTTQ